MQKFVETSSVNNKKRNKPKVLNEAAHIDVLGHFAINPRTSIPTVSKQTNISIGSVHKVLKSNKFFPYKIQNYQRLSEDDYDRRIEFCEEMTQKIQNDPSLVRNICFSDESTFS